MGPEVVYPEKSGHLPLTAALDGFYKSETFGRYRDNTKFAYQRDLRDFRNALAEMGIESTQQINSQAIHDYLTGLNGSPVTVQRHRYSLIAFLSWAAAEQLVSQSLKNDLPENLKIKALPLRYLDKNETVKLRESARSNPRTLALMTLALETGAKLTEVIDLNVEDIRSSEHSVSIRFKKKGKERTYYLRGEPAEAIKQQVGGRESGPLLDKERRNVTNERLTRQRLWEIINELGKTIDRPDLNWQILRNTYISNFSGNPIQLSEALGISWNNAWRLLSRRRE